VTRGPEARPGVVSVVIPTRNRCRRLQLTLRSALAQRAVDLEVVVVDDGSEDDTYAAIGRLPDERVRVVRNDPPRGESGARNRGIAEATGAWIAFLDDDDLWAPDKLQRQVEALAETRREWGYAGDVAIDDHLRVLHGSPPPSPGEVMQTLERHNSVPAGASNVITSAALLARVGPFDPGLTRTADWDMWLRLAASGPPAWVPSPLVAICTHPGNMSRDMGLMFRELDVVARRYRIPVDRARHYRWAAWGALQDGQRWQAVRYYLGALAAGDVRSAGRALVALAGGASANPAPVEGTAWTAEAQAWVDQLARSEPSLGLARSEAPASDVTASRREW
jgi:glycosyltransferase involved in cell wall biosynthesis